MFLGVLSLFANFARMSRSRRFGERQKAMTGTSLKMFPKHSVDCRMGYRQIIGKTNKIGFAFQAIICEFQF